LTLRELGAVLNDVRAIARSGISANSEPFPGWELIPNGVTRSDEQREAYYEWAVRRDLGGYQKVLRQAIGALTSASRAVLHIGTSIAFEINLSGQQEYPTLLLQKPTIDTIFMAFDFRLLFVLQRFGDRLGLCPRKACSKVFLKTRADKEYCSRECGTVERVRKWRRQQKKGASHGTKKRN
jgi:hypothetical protein